LRTTTLFPSPGSSYDSLMTDTNPPGGSDTLVFSIPGANLFARNLSLNNFLNLIQPPPYFGTNYYNPSNVMGAFQLSLDQNNWFPAQGGGPMSVTISNTAAPGSTTSTFDTEITHMTLTGASQIGTFMLRESPTKQSLGKHSIRPDPRGYRISSFFDVFTELSTDGGASWIPANRSIRLEVSAPPAAPGSLFINKIAGGGVILQWLGPFTLQSAPLVSGPYTDMGAAGGPLLNNSTVPVTQRQQYFRLRQ
jgi:hypothetical protein